MLLPNGMGTPVVDLYPAGVEIPYVGTLDVGFTRRREDFLSKSLARLTDGYWSHVFIGAETGLIIESLQRGLEYNEVSRYKEYDVAILRISECFDKGDPRVIEAIRFMNHEARDLDKESYGWLTIASIFFTIVGQGLRDKFGYDKPFYFGRGGTNICSGIAASIIGKLGYAPDVMESHISPNEFGRDWQVPYSDRAWNYHVQ